MERAAARRHQPRHVRSFFEAAFPEAGGVAWAQEKGRLGIVRVPRSLRDRGRGRSVGCAGPVPTRYRLAAGDPVRE